MRMMRCKTARGGPSIRSTSSPATPVFHGVYLGAAGMLWALDQPRAGRAARPRHDYARLATEVLAAYLAEPEFDGPEPSMWNGEGGIALVAWLLAPAPGLADRLAELVTAEPANETLELMWGSPGLLLIADALLERTGEERWAAAGARSPIGCWPRAVRRSRGSGRSTCTGPSTRSSARRTGSPASSRHSRGGRSSAAASRAPTAALAATAVREGGLANWPPALQDGRSRTARGSHPHPVVPRRSRHRRLDRRASAR